MLTCFDVADYLLVKGDEMDDHLSSPKLQKLTYYAQGFALVLLERPLFAEPVEAWMHGPAVPALHHKYKAYSHQVLPVPGQINFDRFSEDERELLDEVFCVYGQFSGWRLRDMSCEEIPWLSTYAEGKSGRVIPLGVMADFFRSLVYQQVKACRA